MAHIQALCLKLGRGPRTSALITALNQPIRLWQALDEQEEHAENDEVDLMLDEEIDELEEESVSFAAELATSYVPYEADAKEQEVAQTSWKLARVPPGLAAELATYTKYRTDAFVRSRDGSAAQDITVGNDRATILRFMGYLSAEHEITPGLGIFCRRTLGYYVEEWIRALRDKGLRFSTLANYCNSLVRKKKACWRPIATLGGGGSLHALCCAATGDGRSVCICNI